jgi:hypothetical protein
MVCLHSLTPTSHLTLDVSIHWSFSVAWRGGNRVTELRDPRLKGVREGQIMHIKMGAWEAKSRTPEGAHHPSRYRLLHIDWW